MLCIALVAVFALDVADSFACANSDCTIECDMGACDDHEDSTGGAQHHCCHGTAASENTVAGSSVLVQAALDAAPITRHVFIASGYLATLERPPRASTAI